MEDKNKLLYEEKRLLTLYRQMLRKEYDVNNKAKYENNDELKNRVEMQQAIYLIDKLMWTDQYGFVWDTYGPKSMGIEENLNLLDNKEHLIKDLNKRSWTCPKCYHEHERDLNASINILFQGLLKLNGLKEVRIH